MEMQEVTYNRDGVIQYALDHCDGTRNLKYKKFSNNCTNFVSQSMYEGGEIYMDYAYPYYWWYSFNGTTDTSDDEWTTSWAVAHDHAYNLSRNTYNGPTGSYVNNASDLKLGDVIYYDFDYPSDGIFNHAAVVVGFYSNGEPIVAYNTSDVCDSHWDLNASLTKFLSFDDIFYYE